MMSKQTARLYKAEPPVVFDKAKWHLDGEYPSDLPPYQAYVPSGFFVTWLIDRGMLNPDECRSNAEGIAQVQARELSGARFYQLHWDGVLSSASLVSEADAFARIYLNVRHDIYTAIDYMRILASGLPTIYHVKDTWDNYARIEPVIDERFRRWQAGEDLTSSE